MPAVNADFRSDTLTRPTPAMRAAMAEAEVGDDVFGEDPTVALLEREAATVLGKEAALYVPSGTMANQIAIHLHCRPGDEVICEERSHVTKFEAGGIARLTGAAVAPIAAARGFMTPDAIRAAVRPDDPHYARSRLLSLENTHNMAGGTVLDAAGMRAQAAVAREFGMAVHLDGARVANAAVALGVPIADLTAAVDTVSMCLSKGLGAPVGSILGGTAEFIHQAVRVRKAFGGGMRQAGVIAAAGLIALREGPAALRTDHERATRLGAAFADLPGMSCVPPETNIVMLDLEPTNASDSAPRAAVLVDHLAARGVRALAVGPDRLRFVTHRDLDEGAVELCLSAVAAWAGAPHSD